MQRKNSKSPNYISTSIVSEPCLTLTKEKSEQEVHVNTAGEKSFCEILQRILLRKGMAGPKICCEFGLSRPLHGRAGSWVRGCGTEQHLLSGKSQETQRHIHLAIPMDLTIYLPIAPSVMPNNHVEFDMWQHFLSL